MARKCLIACSLLVLVAAVVPCWYAKPLGDAHKRSLRVERMTVAQAVGHEYNTWSGRWAGVGIQYALGRHVETRHGVMLLAVMCAFAVAVSFTMHSVGLRGPYTLLFLAIYWAGMWSPAEGFYDLAASVEYHGGAALLLVLTATVGTGRRPIVVVLAALAVGVVAGFHSLYGLVAIGIGLVASEHGSKPRWVLYTVSAVIGFVVVAVAPGNAVRMAAFDRSLWQSALLVIYDMGRITGTHLSDGRVLLATLVVFWPVQRPDWLRKVNGAQIALSYVAISLAVITINAFVRGHETPLRLCNVLWLAFLLHWTALCWRYGGSLELHTPIRVGALLTVLLGLSLLASRNTCAVATDLFSGRFAQYAAHDTTFLPRCPRTFRDAMILHWPHTLLVAARMGRRGVGVEASPEYCEMSRQRIAKELKQAPEVVQVGGVDAEQMVMIW